MKKLILLFTAFALCTILNAQIAVFINEIHYDDDTSTGDVNEGFEIAGPAGTDLSAFSVLLYRDSGTFYDDIPLSGTISDLGCGKGVIWFGLPTNGIQNGNADGIALVQGGSTVIQLLSYEGTLTASNGAASGMTSVDIGVSESGSTLAGNSLQLIGTGTEYDDFSWRTDTLNSRDAQNIGQNFCSGPALPNISFGASTYSQLENDATNDTIWINLSAVATRTDSVYVSSSDVTATNATDYTTNPDISSGKMFEVNAGDSTIMIIVNMNDDGTYEGDETFTIQIDSTSDSLTIGSPSSLTYTITEDDVSVNPVIEFASATVSLTEGDAPLAVSITFAPSAIQTDTIWIEASNGTGAVYSTDYTIDSTITNDTFMVIINNGDNATGFNFTIIDDASVESTEDVTFTVVGVSGSLVIGSTSSTIISMLDNDIPTIPVYDIATVTTVDGAGEADSLNVTCQLTGVVYGINFRASSTGISFTLIDGTGGIGCFSNPNTFGYTVAEGDSIVVTGDIGAFSGLTQIYLDTIIFISGGHTLKNPTIITTLDESTESDLVRFDSVAIVNPSQWTGTGSGFTVDVTDGTNIFEMRIDNDVDLYSMPVPTYSFRLTGIGGQFDSSTPFDEGYQILPRRATDLDSLGAGTPIPPDTSDAATNCTGATVLETYTFKDFEDQNLISKGWTSETVNGTTDWFAGNFMDDNYAKISNFSASANTAAEAWLISPSFDITTANAPIVNFMTLSKFDGDALQLMVSTDYSGTGDPNSATWVNLTALATWDDDLADWGDWVCSGNISLVFYKSAATYIAFKYTGSDSDGTTWEVDDIAVFNSDALGIEDVNEIQVNVFPNPANDVLNIELDSKELSTIKIVDVSGKELLNISTSKLNNKVSVENLESGLYFVEVNSLNTTYTTKFIKK